MSSVREKGGVYEIQEAIFSEVKSGFTRFQNEDVLFAKITPCMENGKGARVTNLPSGCGCGSTEFHVLRARPDHDSEYIYQLMQWTMTRMKAETFMSGSAGQQRVLSDFFFRFRVFAPSKRAQQKIARILQTIDRAIEQTEALIDKYQQIKAGLMHDLFTRGIGPNGQLRPPREQAPHRYQQTPIGWIPKEWECLKLADVSEVDRGKFTARPRNDPQYYNGDYPFIQTGDVTAHLGRSLSKYGQTLNDKGLTVSKLFPQGTIMVTIAANIADTCIIAIPMCAPDSLVGVIPNNPEDTRFIERCINRRKDWLYARAPQSAQKNINLEDLRPLLIPWPEKLERDQVSRCYETIDRKLSSLEHELDKTLKQKSGLMHDLLTGKVSVTPDPEPAHG